MKFVLFSIVLLVVALGCTTTSIPQETQNRTPSSEVYWVTSQRPCSTIPENELVGKTQFCQAFCEQTLHLPFVEAQCADAIPPGDVLSCACEKKEPYALKWPLTYTCENEQADATHCSDQCDFMGLAYKTSSCSEGYVDCTCVYKETE